MRTWAVAICVSIVGCGGLSRPPQKAELVPSATSDFLAAVSRHDVTAISAMLDAQVAYAGMYFADVACARQFPVPRVLSAVQHPAFASCLAALSLREANRVDPMFGAAVLENAPGIELEVVFRFHDGHPKLAWIGYSGRRAGSNALPTVTPAAFEQHLIAGDKAAAPTAEAARAIDVENKLLGIDESYAWMKVCIDAAGTVTGIHTIETTSPKSEAAFMAAMQAWRFRPFAFGSQPIPVCSLLYLQYPESAAAAAPAAVKPQLPIAFTPPAGALRIPEGQLRRTFGAIQILPEKQDRVILQQAGIDTVLGTFWYCFDPRGNVIDTGVVEGTGLPRYDAKLLATIRTWRYRPYVLDGAPVSGCSAVTWHYSQR